MSKDLIERGISARDLLASGAAAARWRRWGQARSGDQWRTLCRAAGRGTRGGRSGRPACSGTVILGVDPGARRVGIAVADHETRFARPLEVIDSKAMDPVERIGELVRELDVDLIVVGRPVGLSGGDGPAVVRQQEFVSALAASSDVRIVESDERFSSVIADRALRDAGRSVKQARGVRDAVAAQVILQGYLDSVR